MEEIVLKLNELLIYPYLLVIVFGCKLLFSITTNLKYDFLQKKNSKTYLTLLFSLIVGIPFYFIYKTDAGIIVKLVVNYFAATSCYELLFSFVFNKIEEKLKVVKPVV